MIELKAVVVEQQEFPGNLLIGYDTMREEDTTIIPAQEVVKIYPSFYHSLTPAVKISYHQLVNIVRLKLTQFPQLI